VITILIPQINPASSVCFSGHRPDRLPERGDPETPETQKLTAALREQIEDAIRRGKDTFVNGLMAGWDVLAAEQIIALKERHPQIRLFTIAPYAVHFYTREKCWTPEWVARTQEICRRHDFGISIAEHYRPGIYYERNRALVEHSSELLCFWDGGRGGTAYTVQYAESHGLTVHNFFER